MWQGRCDMSSRTLRLLLGDQLNRQHSWFDATDEQVVYLLAELKQETEYATHHVQKLCAFFSAMQSFATELEADGHDVLHLTLDETVAHDGLEALLQHLCGEHSITRFEYQRPDEYRLLEQLRGLRLGSGVTSEEADSEHFLLPFTEIEQQFASGKHKKMEFFYRKMRQRFDILMEDGEPYGGKWNYDTENRRKLQADDLRDIPAPLLFSNDVSEILQRLDRHEVKYIGARQEKLPWPVTRTQALELLEYFCAVCLPNFGRFQDAMTCQSEHQWSLYHSRIAFALNSKMLNPLEVIERALEAFHEADETINIAQAEGFVRQILGWREYIRGMYWANMPDYRELNSLDAARALPDFFWTGETEMKCLQKAIDQSLAHAYAHHIQRLMITGNFCLLAGIDPDQVDAWYLGIYIDAIEWVEMPNTRGMSQFADGGLVATKPYAASGNYVNKMSDYCKECHYDVKEKESAQACPLNSLYWHFMDRHRDRLADNPRIGMLYKNWDRQSKQSRDAVLARAEHNLVNIENL